MKKTGKKTAEAHCNCERVSPADIPSRTVTTKGHGHKMGKRQGRARQSGINPQGYP